MDKESERVRQGGASTIVWTNLPPAAEVEFPHTAYRLSSSQVEHSNRFETDERAKEGTLLGRLIEFPRPDWIARQQDRGTGPPYWTSRDEM